MGSTLFRDPQARGSALAALWTLQPQAFGSLNSVEPLDSVSNYYVEPELISKIKCHLISTGKSDRTSKIFTVPVRSVRFVILQIRA